MNIPASAIVDGHSRARTHACKCSHLSLVSSPARGNMKEGDHRCGWCPWRAMRLIVTYRSQSTCASEDIFKKGAMKNALHTMGGAGTSGHLEPDSVHIHKLIGIGRPAFAAIDVGRTFARGSNGCFHAPSASNVFGRRNPHGSHRNARHFP